MIAALNPFLPRFGKIIQALREMGQDIAIFKDIEKMGPMQVQKLLENLKTADDFYAEMGGLKGYQNKILQLLQKQQEFTSVSGTYHAPKFFDITKETKRVKEAISWGIDSMEMLAEIYPLGGAADRLHLVDEKTGSELPAAKLPFAGKLLLEHLIRDLVAREHLYFQKWGKKIITPIAIMTSHEKNNHEHVLEICEKSRWFNRPKDSFRFFNQPLVPTVDAHGNWVMLGPLNPLLKPGGHGAIWKLARDALIFDWLQNTWGRKKALVRQINNPIAGLDYGLLAFTGYGCKKNLLFGFASCPRLLQAAEGVNVLIERSEKIVLTNIEYCDFKKWGIEDAPLRKGEPFSRFTSNTNILFIDLDAVVKAIDSCPFPGLLVNLKKTHLGNKEVSLARLESTMQNIADVFVEKKGKNLKTKKTFITYNLRHKTISTAKKAYIENGPLQETPENCFYDLLFANRELLQECDFQLPKHRSLQEYLEKGPEVLFLYHPVLGPLYEIIQQKLKGGKMGDGSELFIEIANLQCSNLTIDGSLQIIAENPLESSCILENVKIINRGIDWTLSRPFWKMDLAREESAKIILKGKSHFAAKNIELKGNQILIVEDGKTRTL